MLLSPQVHAAYAWHGVCLCFVCFQHLFSVVPVHVICIYTCGGLPPGAAEPTGGGERREGAVGPCSQLEFDARLCDLSYNAPTHRTPTLRTHTCCTPLPALTMQEKEISRMVTLAFGQKVCGFDLLRSEKGKRWVMHLGRNTPSHIATPPLVCCTLHTQPSSHAAEPHSPPPSPPSPSSAALYATVGGAGGSEPTHSTCDLLLLPLFAPHPVAPNMLQPSSSSTLTHWLARVHNCPAAPQSTAGPL